MTDTIPERPLAAVGVMIFNGEGHILLGKRKNAHGAGEYAFPGGHMEYMESPIQCAQRETREECGIEITEVAFQFLANVTAYAPRHYVHIGVTAEWKSGMPEVHEPHKCVSWEWYPLNDLPQPLFKMAKCAIDSYRSGSQYYDDV